MKNFISFLLVSLLILNLSCSSDDSSTNPKADYAIKMNITGDKNIEFKTNEFAIIPPGSNPNLVVTFTMRVNGVINVFAMTIDNTWIDKDIIDLSRNENRGNIQFEGGKESYQVSNGTFSVQELTTSRIKGTLNFTATKLGSTDIKIEVVNGIIDLSK